MRNRSTLTHLLAFLTILIGGVWLVATKGWVPLSSYSHPDPNLFVEHSTRIARTGGFFHKQDPPLRYVPLVILYVLFAPSPDLAGRLASLYASVWTFLLTPLAGYALLRVQSTRLLALIGTAGMVIGYGFSVIPTGFSGPWQFAVSLPYAYTALYCATKAERTYSKPWITLTGILLGLTALTQILVAGFAAVVIAIVFLSESRFKELAGITGVSMLTASPLLLLPRLPYYTSIYLRNDILGVQTRHAVYTNEGIFAISSSFISLEVLINTITSLSFWIWTTLPIAAAVIVNRRNDKYPHGDLLFTTFLYGTCLWVIWSITTLGYIGHRILMFMAPLAVAITSAGLFLMVSEHLKDKHFNSGWETEHEDD